MSSNLNKDKDKDISNQIENKNKNENENENEEKPTENNNNNKKIIIDIIKDEKDINKEKEIINEKKKMKNDEKEEKEEEDKKKKKKDDDDDEVNNIIEKNDKLNNNNNNDNNDDDEIIMKKNDNDNDNDGGGDDDDEQIKKNDIDDIDDDDKNKEITINEIKLEIERLSSDELFSKNDDNDVNDDNDEDRQKEKDCNNNNNNLLSVNNKKKNVSFSVTECSEVQEQDDVHYVDDLSYSIRTVDERKEGEDLNISDISITGNNEGEDLNISDISITGNNEEKEERERKGKKEEGGERKVEEKESEEEVKEEEGLEEEGGEIKRKRFKKERKKSNVDIMIEYIENNEKFGNFDLNIENEGFTYEVEQFHEHQELKNGVVYGDELENRNRDEEYKDVEIEEQPLDYEGNNNDNDMEDKKKIIKEIIEYGMVKGIVKDIDGEVIEIKSEDEQEENISLEENENERKSENVEDNIILSVEEEVNVRAIEQMGFSRKSAAFSLKKFNFDVQDAVNYILEQGEHEVENMYEEEVIELQSKRRNSITMKRSGSLDTHDSWDYENYDERRIESSEHIRKLLSKIKRHRKDKKKRKRKKKKPKVKYIPPDHWSLNPEMSIPVEFNRDRTKIIEIGQDMIITIISFCDFKSCMSLSNSHNVFDYVLRLSYVWEQIIIDKLGDEMKDEFLKYLRNQKLINKKGNFLESINYKESFADYRALFVKREIDHAIKNERIRVKDNRYYKWEEKGKYYVMGIFIVLLVVGLLIFIITTPLILDNLIPYTGYYWLIPFVLPGVILPTIFLLFYLKNSFAANYFPLCLPLDRRDKDLYRYDNIVLIQTGFVWGLYYLIAFGVKMAFLREYNIWSYIFIPGHVIMLYTFISFSICLYDEFFNSRRQYVISFIIGMFFVDFFMIITFVFLGLKFDGIFGDGFYYSYLIIPVSFTIFSFVLSLLIPLGMNAKCDCGDCEDCCAELCLPLLLPGFVSGILVTPIIIFIILLGLRADLFIICSYVVTFIPIYSVVGIFLLILFCVGCGVGCYFVCGCLRDDD